MEFFYEKYEYTFFLIVVFLYFIIWNNNNNTYYVIFGSLYILLPFTNVNYNDDGKVCLGSREKYIFVVVELGF